ncbi:MULTISPECIES: CBO0543 family protein [Bacillaceae]|uniref:CBO0543 family protein n=1 Tax=Bacillaceae TaxID=186817 RepID=UPI001C55B6A3|nr:CBO0543 family protein [Rossellomorea sp. YZS02]MBW3112591.1 hypothetical protein [Bacillus sp. MCCB 382]MDX8344591.1 CBO0543 family protein [Rossellomorea sp. YZS02]
MKEQYDQIQEKVKEIKLQNINYWLDDCFLSLQWWFILTLFILTWVAFIRLTKNAGNKPKLFFLGLVWIIVAANLDGMGYELGLWGYPCQLIPLLPKAYVFDYALIPVTYMLQYQYFPKGKAFFYSTLMISGGASFIAEPFFRWLHIYTIYKWEVWWSFIIYFILAYLIRWVVEYVFRSRKIGEVWENQGQ